MTDNVTVSNSPLYDYNVRATETVDSKQIQHVRLDVGVGTAESQVTGLSGLPVAASASPFVFQAAFFLPYNGILGSLSEVGTIQADAVILWFYNNTDAELYVSFDNSHRHVNIPPKSTFSIDGRTNNRYVAASTVVHVSYNVIAPTEGFVSVNYIS